MNDADGLDRPDRSERGEHGRTAAALADLSSLDERALAEHPEVFQRIHGELQSALAEIDTD